jgi:phage FluMu protein Com
MMKYLIHLWSWISLFGNRDLHWARCWKCGKALWGRGPIELPLHCPKCGRVDLIYIKSVKRAEDY